MVSDRCIIRPLGSTDSLDELTDLLHRGYKQLADMGLRYLATHQSVDITCDRIKNATCLVAVVDGRIVGTLCYYSPRQANGCAWYDRPEVASVGQFAIEPSLQRQGIGTRMMRHAETLAVVDGATELALDTAEPATHLINWYTRLGYRLVERADWPETNYRSVILSKRLGKET